MKPCICGKPPKRRARFCSMACYLASGLAKANGAKGGKAFRGPQQPVFRKSA